MHFLGTIFSCTIIDLWWSLRQQDGVGMDSMNCSVCEKELYQALPTETYSVKYKKNIENHQTHPLFTCIHIVWPNCVRTEGCCAVEALFSLRSFLKWATGESKASVNRRDTRRFQHRAPTRPPEPTVGEYSSLLIKSFWLQRGRSDGLFLWPAGLQRELQWLVWIIWAAGMRKSDYFF